MQIHTTTSNPVLKNRATKVNESIARSLCDLVGNTPLLELRRLFRDLPLRVLVKMESMNPTSIKDRAAHHMIRAAIARGDIGPGTEVVEISSGNTAIAVASLGAMLGFRTRFFMSASASRERRQMLAAYGATIVLTPAAEHTRGARERALAYCRQNPDTTFFLNQHGNPDNSAAHVASTGPELWTQTGGKLDALVVGLGTAGTFEGMARYLKSKNPDIKIIAFEPQSSPVYSGGKQAEHRIQGIGPGFVSENFKRGRALLDELITVPDEAAWDMVRQLARREGILAGPTSGASLWVCRQLAERPEFEGKTIVGFVYDSGERYLSVKGLFPESKEIYAE